MLPFLHTNVEAFYYKCGPFTSWWGYLPPWALPRSTGRGQWRRQRSKGARSFRGQKILQPSQPDALFPQKSFFSCCPQHTGRQRRFTVKIKQIKRSDMVTFLFSVHTITEAKHYPRLGRAVDLPARSWRALSGLVSPVSSVYTSTAYWLFGHPRSGV